MLVGLGRGSAAGSLLSMFWTSQIDPIKYALQFERFLTKGGKGYPDIDFDVEEPMELKQQLAEEWGKIGVNVVPISNFNTLQLRSLIKDIGKFYDIPFMEGQQGDWRDDGGGNPSSQEGSRADCRCLHSHI